MRINDIIKEDDSDPKGLSVDQVAQIQAAHGEPIPNSVITRAKRIVSNGGRVGISAIDAIGMAQDIERKKKKPEDNKQDADKKPNTPMTRREPVDTSDRIGRSGKKWGNQYYQDAPKEPASKRYKDMKSALAKKIGSITKKDQRDLGKDIGSDVTGALDKVMNLGKKGR